MPTDNLVQMAAAYRRDRLAPNPPAEDDYNTILNEFCYKMKLEGKKIGKWDDETWIDAMLALGIPAEECCFLVENIASWGVDD